MSEMTDADIKWCMRHIEPHLKDTDAAVETLLAGVRKCIEKDARLRGEAAQSEQQAVAWLLPSGELFTSAQMEAQRRVYGDTFGLLAEPLYTRPQPAAPAPVAGDAVVAVIADMRMYNTAGPNAVYLRTTKWIKELEAALSTQHGDNT